MPCGKKRKRHKIATHKRKKRLRRNRHKKKSGVERASLRVRRIALPDVGTRRKLVPTSAFQRKQRIQ
jgi:hypothetical protein